MTADSTPQPNGPRRLWWRDDDFTAYIPYFHALEATSETLGVRPLVSAIPGAMADNFVLRDKIYCFAAHGWLHRILGCSSNRPSEYGDHRTSEEVLTELKRSRARARDLLEDSLIDWFVPPYNHMSGKHFPALLESGFEALCASESESHWRPLAGRMRLPHVHVDIWDYRLKRVKDPQVVEAELEAWWRRPRSSTAPLGLMTHHKMMRGPEAWPAFLSLVRHLRERGWVLEDCDAGYCAAFPSSSAEACIQPV